LCFLLERIKQDAFTALGARRGDELEHAVSAVSSGITALKENVVLAEECGIRLPDGVVGSLESGLNLLQSEGDGFRYVDGGIRISKAARDAIFDLLPH